MRIKAYVADDCVFDAREQMPAIAVIEDDHGADTGLLDAQGNKIYRVRRPIGFRDSTRA